MTAFTRFCTLCHFDLNFLCRSQILGSNAKPSGSNLLDCGTFIICTAGGLNPFQIFTAFAAVGLAADSVHGNCHTFMCFFGNRTIGHRTGLEATHDALYAFYFFNRNTAVFIIMEVQCASQCNIGILVVDASRILLKQLIVIPPSCLLQQVNGCWIVQMLFSSASCLMATDDIDNIIHLQAVRIKGRFMHGQTAPADVVQVNAANPANRIREVCIDDILADSQCFKNFRALIRLDGGNSHLRSNLYNTGYNSMNVILTSL